MEKIKVNMSPNPLDVQTIHASQNDGEAREWEFELHNNGELIDTSGITEQMFFKSYEGGTEEILPTNGSVPTTSPIIADIKYPQGLLTDQEFAYRQSPTEEDGLAKITDIKGNTLVWNQLVAKGNMTDGWTFTNSSGGYSNNVLTFTASARSGFVRPDLPQQIISGHKYLGTVDVKGTSAFSSNILFVGRTEGGLYNVSITTEWKTFAKVFTNTVTEANYYPRVIDTRNSDWDAVQIRNCMLIDLTQMGLDSITDPAEFISLFPLPYYEYNAGTLLSFNGTGIKTVGKNIFDGVLQNGTIDQYGREQSQANRYRTDFLRVFPNTRYVISVDGVIKNVNIFYYDINKNFISSIGGSLVTTPSNCAYMRFYYDQSIFNANLQLEMLESGNNPTPYEPYTSSTLSLPISTYFPTGMKSAGNVYDELTPNKAITRVGMVDLGSLTWNRSAINEGYAFASSVVNNLKLTGNVATANALCANYTLSMVGNGYSMPNDKSFRVGGTYFGMKRIAIRDDSYTDATAFKQAMQGVYLYYELATPTETSFTTASLVTENAEIPLSNEDGTLIGKCTEQLSENPGFIDAKIKLSDSDGECYSNKIQLHVERSPQ